MVNGDRIGIFFPRQITNSNSRSRLGWYLSYRKILRVEQVLHHVTYQVHLKISIESLFVRFLSRKFRPRKFLPKILAWNYLMWSLIRMWNSWFSTLCFQVVFSCSILKRFQLLRISGGLKKRWIGGGIWPFGHSGWLCIANEISMSACWCSITCSSWYGSYGMVHMVSDIAWNESEF